MSTLNIDNDYIHLNSASSDKVVVEGNLGIGTTSPTQKLTIGQSGESINYIRVIATTADFYMGANATGPHLGVTNGAKILQTNSYPLVIGTTANQELYLGANNATIATLVDGKFGIGTTSPAYKLHILDSASSGRAIQAIQSATSGTNYGAVFAAEGSGATKNVGLYANATGATTNYAAIFDNGNV